VAERYASKEYLSETQREILESIATSRAASSIRDTYATFGRSGHRRRVAINWRPAKTWGRSSGDRDWGGIVCCCSADVVPEAAVQVGGAHVQQ
jgi:hypothetical protein